MSAARLLCLAGCLATVFALFPITVSVPGVQFEKCPDWRWANHGVPVMPCGSTQVAYPLYMIIGGPQWPYTFGIMRECRDTEGRVIETAGVPKQFTKNCTKLFEVTVLF